MGEIDLYDRHPINAAQILDAVRAEGKDTERLRPSDLRPHDQDHYGGVEVVHRLADAARIGAGGIVADVCAGMGGPARLIAETRRTRLVIGLDYNWSRCRGAADLNGLVGMADRVAMVRCDAQSLPLGAASLDAAVSQEALLHIRDKGRVLEGVFHALKPGGRFVFTDVTAGAGLSDGDRRHLAEDGMQMVTLQTADGYRAMAAAAGFAVVRADDLSDDWKSILTERLEMYRRMESATEKVHGADAHRRYMDPYAFFVGLVQQGRLGGIRMVLERPAI